MDRNLNELLKWSIENQVPNEEGGESRPTTTLSADAIKALMGGPSDADLMVSSMQAIRDPEVTLDNKLIAFDNFEQLIESLDNANNMANLALWTPLLECLADAEPEIRRMAAWCVGTAVQNNEPSQERFLAVGGVPKIVALALSPDERENVRRKAVYAVSSAVRNYQPASDVCTEELAKHGWEGGKVDAQDMDAVDGVTDFLKAKIPKA